MVFVTLMKNDRLAELKFRIAILIMTQILRSYLTNFRKRTTLKKKWIHFTTIPSYTLKLESAVFARI